MLNGRLESTGGILGVSGGQLASQDMNMKMMISPDFWTVLFKRCLDLLLMGFRLSLVLLNLVVLMCIISTKNQAFGCVFFICFINLSMNQLLGSSMNTEQHGDGVRTVHAQSYWKNHKQLYSYTVPEYVYICIPMCYIILLCLCESVSKSLTPKF